MFREDWSADVSRRLVSRCFKTTGQPMFQEDWAAYVPRRLVSLCSKKTADPNQSSTKTSRRFVSGRRVSVTFDFITLNTTTD
ncbi:hypothetical protein TNIN_461041 [Trichonephila inaurata madagascariensis]|uniref:Uncharacterized protein n=1 Tax=Trichonephila inaurata madagascariensis TaxID=2747483 RepID=A0A8X6KLM3_9ARAC|nr:hypothetical protein TNIN_461041 [Trichonephila inaurata madagascariensis]